MTDPLEKTVIPTKKSPEKELLKFKDPGIEEIFEKNKELLGKDVVFKKIYASLKEGWDELNKNQKLQVLSLIENLIKNLGEYHNAYVGLKGAVIRREYFDDVEKYQEAIKNADRQEKILHDTFLDSINILSRKMKSMGLNNSWRSDENLYGVSPETQRNRAKFWMFKIFREEDFAIRKMKKIEEK